MSHIEVVLEDLSTHPHCVHGPTVLFSRTAGEKSLKFFACAACRDRKDCPFYLTEHEKNTVSAVKIQRWLDAEKEFVRSINHRKSFLLLSKVKQIARHLRKYCFTCNVFIVEKYQGNHDDHDSVSNIDDTMLSYPSKFLNPLDNAKKEAQFLFSDVAVKTIVDIIRNKGFTNIICMGAPRIHEYVLDNYPTMSSILLDIDQRYHSFFGPLQFCWYNMFNNHFFLSDSRNIFKDFIQSDRGRGFILVTDPPFGARVELLVQTIGCINKWYQSLNNLKEVLPVLWFFPYFMEPQILNSLPEFSMLDYKVDYDNHSLFKEGPKGRKYGSPVRIFTNIDPSTITLPADQGYKHCCLCNRWVALENEHCVFCNVCTSKDGRTYSHCKVCNRCVKPTWVHCSKCGRCAQPDHVCQKFTFEKSCFHCKEIGHKKRECPKVNHKELQQKRKIGIKIRSKKLKLL